MSLAGSSSLHLDAARTAAETGQHLPSPARATQAKSYSFDEDIPAPPPTQATPPAPESDRVARATPTPKPPPPVPQTIFAAREQSVSELFLPYGRLLRCELVNTVDSTNIDTPIIGLVIEDTWNAGRLIIPVGTEIHGVAHFGTRDRPAIARILETLRQTGTAVAVEDLARVSPLLHRHVIPNGTYHFPRAIEGVNLS